MSAAKPKEIIEIDASQLVALRRRVEAGTLEPDDFATIDAVLESYAYVTQLIDQKSTRSIVCESCCLAHPARRQPTYSVALRRPPGITNKPRRS